MSDGFLSQEEIDALLKGEVTTTEKASDVSEENSTYEETSANTASVESPSSPSLSNEVLNEMDKDALGELGNISMGGAATTLSILLGKRVSITTPKTTVTTIREIKQSYPMPYVIIEVGYTHGIMGTNLLAIKASDALIMADLMMGGDGLNAPPALNELYMSAITEAMNQMMGSVATSLATIFKKKVDIAPPSVNLMDLEANPEITEKIADDVSVAKIAFKMEVEGLIDSEVMQIISIDVAREMVSGMMGSMNEVEGQKEPEIPVMQSASAQQAMMPPSMATVPPMAEPPPPMAFSENNMNAGMMHSNPPGVQYPQQSQPGMYPPQGGYPPPMYAMPPQQQGGYPPPMYGQPQQAMYGQPMQGQLPPQPQQIQSNVQAQPAQFTQFQTNALNMSETNINLLLDVPLHITVELGRTRKLIREILELAPGSVVELDKLAGEPVDILVNGKLVAKGEVVVIDENFGVRVTDIVSRLERFNNLQ